METGFLIMAFVLWLILQTARLLIGDKVERTVQRKLPARPSRMIDRGSDMRKIPLPIVVTSPIGAHVYELAHDTLALSINATPERVLIVRGVVPGDSHVLEFTEFHDDLYPSSERVISWCRAHGIRAFDDHPKGVHIGSCIIDATRLDMTLHLTEPIKDWATVIDWLKALQGALTLSTQASTQRLLECLRSPERHVVQRPQALDDELHQRMLATFHHLCTYELETLRELSTPEALAALNLDAYFALMLRWTELFPHHELTSSHVQRLRTLTHSSTQDHEARTRAASLWCMHHIARSEGWEPLTREQLLALGDEHPLELAVSATQSTDLRSVEDHLRHICDALLHHQGTDYTRESEHMHSIELHPQIASQLDYMSAMMWPFAFHDIEPLLVKPSHGKAHLAHLIISTITRAPLTHMVTSFESLLEQIMTAPAREVFAIACSIRRDELRTCAKFFAMIEALAMHHEENATWVLDLVCRTWPDSPHLSSCIERWLGSEDQEIHAIVADAILRWLPPHDAFIDVVVRQLHHHPEHPLFLRALRQLPTDHPSTKMFLIMHAETSASKRLDVMRAMRPEGSEESLGAFAELALTRMISSPVTLSHGERQLAIELLGQHGGAVAIRAIVTLIDHTDWAALQPRIMEALDTLRLRHPHITQGALTLQRSQETGSLTVSD